MCYEASAEQPGIVTQTGQSFHINSANAERNGNKVVGLTERRKSIACDGEALAIIANIALCEHQSFSGNNDSN